MNTTVSLRAQEGALTYWSLGAETDPDILIPGLESLGFPKFAPEPRTWLMSLKASLTDQFTHNMVRPLKSRTANGYTIVKEIRGIDENNYPRIGNARIDTVTGDVEVTHGELNAEQLQDKTNHYRRVLPGASVSSTLVELLNDSLGGIALRQNGGVYFVPDHNAGVWMEICELVERAATGASKNAMTVIPLEMNDMTLRDIKEAIVHEVTTETARIRRDIAENDYGDRAISNRISRSTELIHRVRFYEDLLGEVLDTCREALIQTSIATTSAVASRQDNEVFEDMYS